MTDSEKYKKFYLAVARMLREEQAHSKKLEERVGNQRKELARLYKRIEELSGERFDDMVDKL